jgi:hypothetical protein
LYVYSVIEDAINHVKYFSDKLPRVIGSFGAQPVAITTGNVYATCMSQTTSTAGDVRSLGDVSSNKLRDTFARNVAALTAGVKNNGAGTVTITSALLSSCSALNNMVCTANKGVLYVKGDAIIDNPTGGNITWTGNKTIVVIGGSLKINKNIYNLPGVAKPRLGIIVMKDYTNASEPKTAGNVYVESKVTDIQANIVATDGALLSYVDDVSHGVNAITGLPVFASVQDMNSMLKNTQFWLTGSLASNNTIGGGTLNAAGQMFDGLCRVTTDSVTAQLYDLNYLKQYVGEFQRDGNGAPIKGITLAPATGELTDDQLVDTSTGKPIPAIDGGYLWPPAAPAVASIQDPDKDRNLGSTYLVFDPPPSNLLGFAGENIFAVVIRTQ